VSSRLEASYESNIGFLFHSIRCCGLEVNRLSFVSWRLTAHSFQALKRREKTSTSIPYLWEVVNGLSLFIYGQQLLIYQPQVIADVYESSSFLEL